MRGRAEVNSELPLYESRPPPWLPKAHSSADLGYSGFHPPRPGKDEDVLCISSIKNGFVLNQAVSAETFSAQTTLSDSLRSEETIARLEELMNELFSRRASYVPAIPPSTFRIPSRVTLNDAKRQAWFSDLANPDVPLHRLGKNVPHGAKGHDLLDLLQSNNVAIPRAVWFLRVFGANETAGLRNKPSYNPTHYSIEWTNVMTSYMKKQLAEIKLPSAPRPGLNIKQTFKGVLADFDSRERWVSRFAYCLQLLRAFYPEGLVDHRTLLSWIVEQMSTCNLAQAAFVTRIADEYFDGMVGSRPLMQPLAEACLTKISEIPTSPEPDLLVDTENLLKILVQRICLTLPDAFVSPRMWSAHQQLLEHLLTQEVMIDRGQDPHVDQNGQDMHNVLLNTFVNIRRRNDAMLFRSLPSLISTNLGSAISDVELLNSICHTTDISTLVYFPDVDQNPVGFGEKLHMLLTWSITSLQFGQHRPFAAVTIIRHWRIRTTARAARRCYAPHDELLQDHLFDWLDKADVAGQPTSLNSISLLYGMLIKHDLFSYASYIQRLIARGDLGLSSLQESQSRHYNLIQWIPLHTSTPSLISQRRVTLYGTRARDTPENANEKVYRDEIRAALPEMFGVQSLPEVRKTELLVKCTCLLSATRFEQDRIFRLWLLPLLCQFIASDNSDMTRWPIILRTYCLSAELIAEAKCYGTLLELTLRMLHNSNTLELLTAVMDTLNRFATIWACMDAMGQIVDSLFSAHQVWKTRGIQSRQLFVLLMEFDNGRYLSDDCREQLSADLSSFTLTLQPNTGLPNPVPEVLPEILLLARDPAADAPSLLANGLWIKYRRSHDWAWKVWDNTVASLRQVPLIVPEAAERQIVAQRYGNFLRHVDRHLPRGLDESVLEWFLGRGQNEVSAISAEAWDIVVMVLVFLAVHGALETTTILRGLVYPCWRVGASLLHQQESTSFDLLLTAANTICSHLLLQDNEDDKADLFDDQCIRTRRHNVYREPHFPFLVSSIPVLVALENNKYVAETHRLRCRAIRYVLCEREQFRRGVFRNLAVVREAFEQTLPVSEEACGDLTKDTITALKMVLCESTDDIDLDKWTDSSLLSPWKIAATTVHLQFVLRRVGEGQSEALGAGLDKLTSILLEHTFSSEEAYFVAQMTKGVGASISTKFINNGLQCVTDILNNATFEMEAESTLKASLQRAGEVLRALIYITEPSREDTGHCPTVDAAIQDKFFCALSSKISELVSLPRDLFGLEDSSLPIVLLARLLQFDLGLEGKWTPKTIEESTKLANCLFQLVLRHSTGESANLIIYPLLIDTFYFLMDEMPNDSKTAALEPFHHYPDMPISDLPRDIPVEYREQLRSLLPFHSCTTAVDNLVACHREMSGNLVQDGPVMNRPWEWIENLGEPPSVADSKEEEPRSKFLIKNSGSLSLDNFGAQMTGERIFQTEVNEEDARIEGTIRSFEDNLHSDNIFQRDWRETRLDLEIDRMKTEGDSEMTPGPTGYQQPRRTHRESPSSTSAGSRHSTRQSPSRHSASTNGETVDADSMISTSSTKKTSSKRRASSEDDVVAGPNKVKKQKTSGTDRPKARKR